MRKKLMFISGQIGWSTSWVQKSTLISGWMSTREKMILHDTGKMNG